MTITVTAMIHASDNPDAADTTLTFTTTGRHAEAGRATFAIFPRAVTIEAAEDSAATNDVASDLLSEMTNNHDSDARVLYYNADAKGTACLESLVTQGINPSTALIALRRSFIGQQHDVILTRPGFIHGVDEATATTELEAAGFERFEDTTVFTSTRHIPDA